MINPIMWSIMILLTLMAFPGIIDLIREGVGLIYDDVTFYGPRAVRRLVWSALIYIAIICLLTVFATFALAGGNTWWFAIISFIIAGFLWPLSNAMNKFVSGMNAILPSSVALAEPKMTIVMMLGILYSGITALLFPEAFFSWFGVSILALYMVGMVVMIAFPSPNFYSRYVFGGLSVATFLFWIVCGLFPVFIEGWTVSANANSAQNAREILVKKLAERPVQYVVSDKGALVWKVQRYSTGQVKKNSSGLAMLDLPTSDAPQKHIPKGKAFKTLDIAPTAVDAGEPLVEVYFEAADGTWVQTGEVGNQWIAISTTDLASPSTSSSGSGEIAVNGVEYKAYADATKSEGVSTRVLKAGTKLNIRGSGTAVWKNLVVGNPTKYEECGPEGTSPTRSSLISKEDYYSNINQYLCPTALKGALIAKIGNGSWFAVGNNYTGEVTSDGVLTIAVNDLDPGKHPILNWQDNSKGFAVTYSVN